MEEANTIHLRDSHEQSEEEEALSLRGLVLNSDDAETIADDSTESIRSSSEEEQPLEFFEFFNDVSSEMSHAEDIISCGKLVPFKEQFHSDRLVLKRDEKLMSFGRRRSESMSELKPTRGGDSIKNNNNNIMRSSRSLDYQKLYGNTKYSSMMRSEKSTSEIERSSSIKSSGKNDGGKLPAKPRWYVFLFGPGKVPFEMALQDIKSRQERRSNPVTLFTSLSVNGEKEFSERPDDRRSSSFSWDLLNVLSCKNNASVAVTASLGCLQQV